MTIEQRDRLLGDLMGCSVVIARECEQIAQRESGFEQLQPGLHDGDVARCELLGPVVHARDQESFARDGFEQRVGDARTFRQLGERKEFFRGFGDGDRGGERRVGCVEVAAQHPADEREGQAFRLEVADPGQPFEMVRPVPGDPALTRGRIEQSSLLVEADRVDRHVGPLGEVFDPESIHGVDCRSDHSHGCYRAPRTP